MLRITALALACSGYLVAACGGAPNPFRSGDPPPPPAGAPGEVAIPYGTEEEEDVTGAVTALDPSETAHMQSVLEMLRGHVPGLQVTELPNGDIRLRLRGGNQSLREGDRENEPLVVIDDLPVRPGGLRLALKGLNPRQVQSIQVLRDVSTTAVYGTRGANGVILIYMKR